MRKINLFFVLLVAWMLGTGVAIAQEKGKNPLLAVAEYNLEADGNFATGDVMTAYGAFFKWNQVKNLTVPAGYHVPSKTELMTVCGRFSMDEQPRPPYPILTWKMDQEADEEVTLFGKTMTLSSHYYGEGKKKCFALRFKGGDNQYLSAYRWELIPMQGNAQKSLALKITCRLLGPKGVGVDVKTLAADDYWQNNNEADVVRYFPTSGYGNYTDDGEMMDRNELGRYWSSTPREESNNGAWGFGFDNNFIIAYYWIVSSRYNVRCFANNTETGVTAPQARQAGNLTACYDASTATVVVGGLQHGARVCLYRADGSTMVQTNVVGETLRIGASGMTPGIYFVTSGTQSVKLLITAP